MVPRFSRAVAWIGTLLACAAVFGVFVRHCLVTSSRKFFWTDEVLTLLMVHETSCKQMLAALRDTINAMPPTYFVCLWLWSKPFGTSELSLRMFSCLGICLAWLLCWLLLRTFCTPSMALIATSITMLGSRELLYFNIEARCYALYLAAYIAAGLCFVLSARKRQSPWVGGGSFLAHATLVTTHYIGVLYSGALIMGAVVAWRITRYAGMKSYVLWSCGGAALCLLDMPFLLDQRALGTEGNWLKPPDLRALWSCYGNGSVPLHAATLSVAVCAATKYALFDKSWQQGAAAATDDWSLDEARGRRLAVLIFVLVSTVMPTAVWAESHVGLRLFLDRYLVPSFIIWPCLLGLSLDCLARSEQDGWSARLFRVASWTSCAGLAIFALITMVQYRSDSDVRIKRMQHVAAVMSERGLDFVTSSDAVYLPAWHFQGHKVQGLKYLRSTSRAGDRKYSEHTEHFIIDAVERNFLHGTVITPEDLGHRRGKFLMLAQDRAECLADGSMPAEFRVIDDLGQGLILVER